MSLTSLSRRMPCDGKNENCERRRELLSQLKCLISSMERKKPCEWDEPSSAPMVYCPAEQPLCCLPCDLQMPVKKSKLIDLRGGVLLRCECVRRNGLQDRCLMWDCMGRPECMTKLYPVCGPARAVLLKLTDLGDEETALRKFYCADRAREAALAAYCRLVCDKDRRAPSCYKSVVRNVEPLACASYSALNACGGNVWDSGNLWCSGANNGDFLSSCKTPAYPCALQSCGAPRECSSSKQPVPICLPICPPVNYLPYIPCNSVS